MKKILRLKYISITLISVILVWLSYNAISIYLYSKTDTTAPADVIIVLGAQTDYDTPSPVFAERINHAIDLYNNKMSSKIIFTGGKDVENKYSEAEAARVYAINAGVPESDIIIEDNSEITLENIAYSYIIMQENNLKTAIIVSDPLHMKRAMLMAKDSGIIAFSSATPTTLYKTPKSKFPFLLRETFYYSLYQIYRLTGGTFDLNISDQIRRFLTI
ncbi:MAG: YdcF family protein [Monoglobaceae bacterium]